MSQIPASVYLIVMNEEANLRKLLPTLSNFVEVVIVDSGSKDKTEEVARTFPNVHFSYRAWTGFGEQKQHALSLCHSEWVLNLDADEELTPEYLSELQTMIAEDKYDALQSIRILLRWGRKPRSFLKEDVLIRFFRRRCGHYPPVKVHERIIVEGRIKTSSAALLHHENITYSQRIQKSNQYSQLKAEDKFAKGSTCSWLHIVLIFPLSFIQCYLGKGCVLDGIDGVLTSMNHAFYNFMKYAKLWELQRLAKANAASSQ